MILPILATDTTSIIATDYSELCSNSLPRMIAFVELPTREKRFWQNTALKRHKSKSKAPYIRRIAGDKVSWGIRPENIELVDNENAYAIRKEERKNLLDGVIRNVVNKGTSRIMSLKLKDSGAVLNVEVMNHIFDSLKIEFRRRMHGKDQAFGHDCFLIVY